jgi:DNA-binding SARP family transcriptional activator/predicted negative regulator of RcsB-dependent stress response
MEFRILGPLEVAADGRLLTPSAPRQRALLAMLLLRANRVVSADQLIDQLWGEAPPTSARVTLQTYVLRLRRQLHAPATAGRDAVLVTHPPGYLLRVQLGELDLHQFDRLVDEAGAAMAEGAPERAADKLRAALALWRGPALADVASEFLRRIEATRLEERRWAALEERIEADLAVGRHAQLVGELEALVAEQPLRERLRGQLMLALYRSGRQAEALRVFRDARGVLARELGLEPGPLLQRLERAILAADPSLELAPRPVTVAGPSSTAAAAPCQLPPDIVDFTGREDVLAAVRDLFERGKGESATALAIATVAGKAGVGKTAFAVRAAHQLRSRFPDGQLFVNLRGAEGHAAAPAGVLAEFLRALGVDGTAIPEGVEERARLYRSRLSDRRMLVVLDNAATEDQVRCLLPGGPGCAVLVTSRARLLGLEAAAPIELDVLELDKAVELLGRVAGRQRVAAEPEAARAVALLCGRLPLAIRVAGAKLAARRHWSLARMCERLGDERRRLDELSAGDLEVRASIALSYQCQRGDDRRAFRLLGLLDVQNFAAWVAAALLDTAPVVAEDLVERLVDVHLLEVAGRDPCGETRYRFHDLLRVFARERLDQEEPTARRAALERALGAYLALAERADQSLQPGALPRIGSGTVRRWEPEDLGILGRLERDPLTWFGAERANLVAAVEQAFATGRWELTWRLARALATFFEVRAVWDDWRRTHELALTAACRAGDRRGQAYTLHRLGGLYVEQGRFEKAIACYHRCLSIHRDLGDRLGEADTMHDLGVVHWDQDRFDEAMALLDRCLEIYRALGDRRLEADTLRVIGAIHRDQGRFTEAQACFNRCLRVFRQLGDRRWAAYTLLSLGILHRDRGKFDEAIARLDQCLPIFRQLGDRLGEAYALRNLGSVYRAEDRFDEARGCLDRSLAWFRELSDPLGEATSLLSLGEVYRDQGQLGEAISRFNQCLPVFRRFGFRLWEGRALSNLGDTLAVVGDRRAARVAWSEGLGILQEIGAPEAAQVRARLEADVAR